MPNVTMPKEATPEEEAEDIVEEVEEDLSEDEDFEEVEVTALEDLPPDTEIWEGGPTAGQFLAWREQYPRGVFVTSIDFDDHVVWRPLKRSEYAAISNQIESIMGQVSETEATMLNEELICKSCVLYPNYEKVDFDDLLAGVPTLISQQILERSGFTSISTREMV